MVVRYAAGVAVIGALLATCGCSSDAHVPIESTFGPTPTLPAPSPTLIPEIHVAPAIGWAAEAGPMAAKGLAVRAFATDLAHPRWLYVLPNGDVLVAETNAPERPDDSKGIKGWISQLVTNRAGGAARSADRITLLRDADGDGVAETKMPFIDHLHSPFGMVLVGRDLYVANTDAVLRFQYMTGATQLIEPGEPIFELPAGTINHHWTKNLIASADGSHLFVTVGSNSNAGENGLDKELYRAAILEIDPRTRQMRVFATGLRNPNGLALQPDTGELWTVVNERDLLGSDLVPDFLTSVRDGGFYGWPYSYFGSHVDDRVRPPRPDLVAKAIVPDYALGPHTASLGLAFYRDRDKDGSLPERYAGGAFIGQHGSWNRMPFSGYKVIFVPFAKGKPAGPAEDVLTDFVTSKGEARGRPVGVAIDRTGALLVADDVGNTIWRVQGTEPRPPRRSPAPQPPPPTSAPQPSPPPQPVPERQTAPEQPAAEQPSLQQTAPEQSAPEQPSLQQTAPEQPAPEQPALQQTAPEQPALEQPAAPLSPEQSTPEP
jgi:glucose/arabinose dehydrogenase